MTARFALALAAAVAAAGFAAAQDADPGCAKAVDLKRADLPLAISGGAAAEAIGETEKNIPARLRHKDRAVADADLAELSAAAPDAAHARVDAEAGSVRFGDGVRGRVPGNKDHGALEAETTARIPAHTPEWTDHNDSDPGVTLLETAPAAVDSPRDAASGLPTGKRRHKPAADDDC